MQHHPDLRLSDSIKADPVSLAQKWLLLSEEEVKLHGVSSLFSPTVDLLVGAAAIAREVHLPPLISPTHTEQWDKLPAQLRSLAHHAPPPKKKKTKKSGGCRLLHRTVLLNVEHWIQELFSMCLTTARLGPVVSTAGEREGERERERQREREVRGDETFCQCLVTSLSLSTINAKHRVK